MLNLCLLGSGGMKPLPQRGLTSLFFECDGTRVLIDCGEGAQIFARQAKENIQITDVIFLTHLHADHVLGLPGLIASMSNAERTKSLSIIGPPGTSDFVRNALSLISKPNFRIISFDIKGSGNAEFNFGRMQITSFPLKHSITCLGYCIEIPRLSKFNVDVANQFRLDQKLWSFLQEGVDVYKDDIRYSYEAVFGESRKGVKVVYATDTSICNNLFEYCKDADLAFLDAMYKDSEQAQGKGCEQHMTFEEAATVAKECNVKELILTHFSPQIVNPAQGLPLAREIFSNTNLGFDGYKRTLGYENDNHIKHIISQELFNLISEGKQDFFITQNSALKEHDVINFRPGNIHSCEHEIIAIAEKIEISENDEENSKALYMLNCDHSQQFFKVQLRTIQVT